MVAPLTRQTLEAAATWYVQLNAAPPSETEREAWRDWLAQSESHAQAWARVEKVQRQLGMLPQDVALPTLAGVRARRRAVLKTLGVLLAAGATTWTVGELVPTQAWMAQYTTGKGKRRHLQLADGSQVDLNTNSALDVDFNGQMRLLTLHQGEALIQTAKDPRGRPYVVHTPQGSVRALGTRFSVRSEGDRTEVCVMEHAVEVRSLHNPEQAIRLEAGQRIAFDSDRIDAPAPMPPGAGAWAQGMLTVIEWRLGDFITELNRYRPGFLRCASAVAGLRLSGGFRIDDTDTVLENLSASLPVKVRYLTRYWVSVESA
ncbi:Protein FecR [compost metagenome]